MYAQGTWKRADGEYIKSLGPSSRNLALTLRPKGPHRLRASKFLAQTQIYIIYIYSAISPEPLFSLIITTFLIYFCQAKFK